MRTTFIFIVFLLAFQGIQAQSPGSLDSTFCQEGWVVEGTPGSDDWPYDAFLQPDGKIVIVGYDNDGPLFAGRIARFLPNGNPDLPFGTTGSGILRFGQANKDVMIHGAVRQPNGSIVAAGVVFDGTQMDMCLWRFLPNGTLDTGFGNGGWWNYNLGVAERLWSLHQRVDGRLVAFGTSETTPNAGAILVAGFRPDGEPDSTFGNAGFTVVAPSQFGHRFEDAAMQPDGKFLAIYKAYLNASRSDFERILVRFDTTGALDPTFGTGGVLWTGFLDGKRFDALAVNPNGKIFVACGEFVTQWEDFVLSYNPDGSLNTGFGTNGRAKFQHPGIDFGLDAIAIQADGKILVGGSANYPGNPSTQTCFARLLPNGTQDATFGMGGYSVFDLSGLDEKMIKLMLQPNGRIVALGQVVGTASGYQNILVRLHNQVTVGLADPEPILKASIYPNPASDRAWVEYSLTRPTTVTLRVLDAQGQVMLTVLRGARQPMGENRLEIPLQQLSNGLYWVQLATPQGVTMFKVVRLPMH